MVVTCLNQACVVEETPDNKFQKCGRCKLARYCSRECQIKHWKLHKNICTAPSQQEGFEDLKRAYNCWKERNSDTLNSLVISAISGLGLPLQTYGVLLRLKPYNNSTGSQSFSVTSYNVIPDQDFPPNLFIRIQQLRKQHKSAQSGLVYGVAAIIISYDGGMGGRTKEHVRLHAVSIEENSLCDELQAMEPTDSYLQRLNADVEGVGLLLSNLQDTQSTGGTEDSCIRCFAVESLLRCSRCQRVSYCSRTCQKKHWKLHKQACHQKDRTPISPCTQNRLDDWLKKKLNTLLEFMCSAIYGSGHCFRTHCMVLDMNLDNLCIEAWRMMSFEQFRQEYGQQYYEAQQAGTAQLQYPGMTVGTLTINFPALGSQSHTVVGVIETEIKAKCEAGLYKTTDRCLKVINEKGT